MTLKKRVVTKSFRTGVASHKVSSAKIRPQLQRLLEVLRQGDMIMVWKLDRLGRSLQELFTLINDFQSKGPGRRCDWFPKFERCQ
ncbi:recombinase family protein [Spirosoma flavus]